MKRSRTRRGFEGGIAGTVAMSVLMVIGSVFEVSPMPEPIPETVVKIDRGRATPTLAHGSHDQHPLRLRRYVGCLPDGRDATGHSREGTVAYGVFFWR